MIHVCRLEYHLGDSQTNPAILLGENQLNPTYYNCGHKDQTILSWIVAFI